ncbi:MAG: hypothetical protein N2321_01060 [Melioribacteraceae bacterium]|nr:hypothetical protein [Melioribacteraceae bacterium]
MATNKIYLHLIIIVALFLSSCNNQNINLNNNFNYSISLGTFKTYNEASEFRFQLPNDIRAKIRYELISTKKYKVLIGNFKSSYDAGEYAFNLFLNKKIKSYDIVNNGQVVLDEFINIPFISNYLGQSSIYNYNLKSKIKELILYFNDKDIATINLTNDCDKIFIVTLDKKIKSKIKDADLYLFIRNKEELLHLKSFKNISYLYTYWDYVDSFKVNVVKVDEKNPQKIIQSIYLFDNNGFEKNIKEKEYDLLKEGYPKINRRRVEYFSPNNQFQIKIKNEIEKDIYLKDFKNKSETFIAFTTNKIYDIRWSNDNKYAFVITKPNNEINKNDELIIINVMQNTVIKKFNSNRINDILVRGNFLFFDSNIDSINTIQVYDFEKQVYYDKINSYGGCNLFIASKVIK